jgi:hypothetical protein
MTDVLNSEMKNRIDLKYLLLFIFPVVFVVLQVLIRIEFRYFFLYAHDPSYAYLFNGLILAQGNMKLGLAMHPGTTLHVLVALNIKLIHAFSGGKPLAEDVILHPEFYLNIISYEIIIINALALLFLGIRTYKRQQNIGLSLALQLTPFVSIQGFCFASNVMLEPLLLWFEILIVILLTEYAFRNPKNIKTGDLISVAILTGLGIATKVVFIPMVFLPFFLIDGIRKKLAYAGIVITTFCIFLIPIYQVLPSFFHWIKDLFLHSGRYGSGEAIIIDFQEYKRNLGLVFTHNYIYTAGFLLALIALLVSILPGLKLKGKPNRKKILLGLVVVYILNALMVAKHFSVHYLILSHNLVVFGFLLSIFVLWDAGIFGRFDKIASGFSLTIVLMTATGLLFHLIINVDYSPHLKSPRLKALEFIDDTIRNNQRIIVHEINAYPFIEIALFHGYAYSGGMRHQYINILKKNYPRTYFYESNPDRLVQWDNEQDLTEVLSGSAKTYIFYHFNKDTIPGLLLEKLNKLKEEKGVLSVKTVFKNPETKECMYEIETDSSKLANRIIRHEVTCCDCEKTSRDLHFFLSADSMYSFDKAWLRSSEASYSGDYSLKLTSRESFGMDTRITVRPGFYEISAVRKSLDEHGLIVASGEQGSNFYKATESAVPVSDGWANIRLNFTVPMEMAGRVISVYVWYPGDTTCYFDDLKISYKEIR